MRQEIKKNRVTKVVISLLGIVGVVVLISFSLLENNMIVSILALLGALFCVVSVFWLLGF